jgi:glucosyl-3-phosphoglycerate phosphatase
MTDVILIRHGQSTFNAHYEATGEDPGHFDARLTALGESQAKEAAKKLENEPVDLVITSPLTRAIQTGLHIFGGRGIPFHITCRHRERLESSCDVGRSPKALARDFPNLEFDHLDDIWWHHQPGSAAPFVTEPLDLFQERVNAFRTWISGHPTARVAVIGHGTFFHALTGQWMQNCEIQRFRRAG